MAAKTKQRQQIKKGPHGGMQLVLTEDVQHLGKQGDVVEVRPGYGRNYLVPRGMAIVPTDHNLRLLDRYKIRVRQAREARIADLKSLAEQLSKLPMPGVTIKSRAHAEKRMTEENGQQVEKTVYLLYGSVGGGDIAKALRAKMLQIDPEMVVMGDGPIKEVGVYAVKLHLGLEIEAQVTVAVVPE
jgi:large subunit ribosomal protein L9